MVRSIHILAALAFLHFVTRPATAAVTAGDGGGASEVTVIAGDDGGFDVIADVDYDPSAGSWIKHLQNTGGGISSGQQVTIIETITNVGAESWTDWHEEILSTTTVAPSGATKPGFFFRPGTLALQRNGVPLVQNVDYTLDAMVYNGAGPGSGTGGDPDLGSWEAVWIFFEPGSLIAPTDILSIEKNISEAHLDGGIWEPNEVAEIEQYPTVPEPGSLTMIALAGVLLTWSMRRSRTTLVPTLCVGTHPSRRSASGH